MINIILQTIEWLSYNYFSLSWMVDVFFLSLFSNNHKDIRYKGKPLIESIAITISPMFPL